MGKLSSETLLIQEEKFKTAKKFRPYIYHNSWHTIAYC